VGVKLGCLNHAMLTAEAIERDGIKIAGWIANRVDPQARYADENISTLKEYFSMYYQAPLLARIPHFQDVTFLRLLQDFELTQSTLIDCFSPSTLRELLVV